jgi:catechol 2,3-dioxygenase-like lactoylglutathione lyase family enzyme
MLGNKEVMATVSVKALDPARQFYEGKLGLTVADERQGVLSFRVGSTLLLIYESRFAGTNQATAATWNVAGDIEQVVADLKAKGVAFEHYDLPGLTRQGDLHLGTDMKVAWFKDPDGNIHALVGT